MRKRIKTASGRTTKTAPWLLAMFTAMALTVTSVVPSLQAENAVAAAGPGICLPQDVEMGDLNSTPTTDSGIATWVGQDMYIGAPKEGVTSYGNNDQAINESYAVEAEGTTLVAGKLAINSVKHSWDDYGFRFGIVGFGGQYRPDSGDALVVNGTNSDIKLTDRDGNDVSALGWGVNGRGWVGSLGSNQPEYTVKIDNGASATMNLQNMTPWQEKVSNSGYPGGYQSVYNRAKDNAHETDIQWKATNPLKTVNINGTTDDYSGRTQYFQELSETLGSMKTQSANVTSDPAPAATDYIREKYNAPDIINFEDSKDSKSKATYIGVKMQFNSGTEKRIIFDGGYNASNPDQNSTGNMVAFTLPASFLTNDTANGVVFDFRNIKPNASIVVNVTHAESDTAKTITFNNGWRFWWNGMEISNGYMPKWKDNTEQAPGNNQGVTKNAVYEAYSKASQSILWNFQDTKKLTIRGGQVKSNNNAVHWAKAEWHAERDGKGTITKKTGTDDVAVSNVTDDPAAAMLGSILVPNGSFEDHVTTNGRVWVGEDFSMYNPTAVWEFKASDEIGEGWSSSIIDMDQERHNFPWSGTARTSCSTLSWTKSNEDGSELLKNTSWGVYGSKENAVSGQNPLYVVKDNAGEWNPEDGKFRVDNLEPNNSYFIKEIGTIPGYTQNKHIYEIYAQNTGSTSNSEIIAAYDENGNSLGDDKSKWQIATVGSGANAVTAIANKRSGADLEWGKTAEGDQITPLSGSEWVLKKTDSPTGEWLITDVVKKINSLTIYENDTTPAGETLNVQQNVTFELKAVLDPVDASPNVTWRATPSEGVVMLPSDDGGTVRIRVVAMPPQGRIQLTATASDNRTQDSLTLIVEESAVKTVTVSPKTPSIMIDEQVQLNAVVTGADDLPSNVVPTWSSDREDVATVDSSTGKVTGVSEGKAIITANANGVTDTATVTVTKRGTMLYMNATDSNATPSIHAWNTSGVLLGEWNKPEEQMGKDEQGQWAILVPTLESFTVIIHWNGDNQTQTNQFTVNASESSHSFRLKKTGNTWSAEAITEAVLSLRNNAARKAAPRTAWSYIDTSNWGEEKQLTDQNPDFGKFKISGLANGTYTLQENKAPDKYFVNTTIYTITVTDGNVTWGSPAPDTDADGFHWVEDSPTEYEWEKIDAGYDSANPNTEGDRLAGTTWKLEVFTKAADAAEGDYTPVTENGFDSVVDCTAGEGNANECTGPDKDPVGGKFKIEKLKIGKYRLQETHAPSGYIVEANKYYYFEIDAKSGTVLQAGKKDSFDKSTGAFNAESDTSRSGGSSKVNNFRKPGTAGWEKVTTDGATTTHLKGAEWSMRYQSLETTGEGENQKHVTDITFKITDSGVTCTVTDTKAECGDDLAWAKNLQNQATGDGKYSFEGLPWGKYTVTETKAPDGYNLDSTPHDFVIRPLTADENPDGTSLGTEGDNHFTVSLGQIENTPGVILPETGGEGSSWVVMLGFALTAIAMLGCGLALSRRTA